MRKNKMIATLLTFFSFVSINIRRMDPGRKIKPNYKTKVSHASHVGTVQCSEVLKQHNM